VLRRALLCLALCACGRLSELVVAVDHGDLPNARSLLDRGADPNAEDADGNSALMLAVWHGDADLVTRMLAKHADPKHANDAGVTALHWAVDDLAKTRALVDAGADPNAADAAGLTPLELAAGRDGDTAVVALLLAHGGDAKLVGGRIGAGDAAAARALLEHGTDPKPTAALHLAAARGNVETLQLLLDHGADINARAELGMTPLMWAAQMGRPAAVTFLLAHGANPNIVELFNSSTALMQAAASERADPDITKALLAANADVTPVDDEGASALGWAIRRGNPEIINLLASHEAGPRPMAMRTPHGTRVGDANTPRAAMLRAIPLLEHARPKFRRLAGCPSCHHDALPALALEHAHAIGLPIDLAARTAEAHTTAESFRSQREKFLEGIGFADIVECAYLLVGLAASDYPPDDITAAMARYLALAQDTDGRWPTMMQRTPADGSDVSLTALTIRALHTYMPGSESRIARGRAYLEHVDATTNEDLVYQLLGLHWAGAPTTAALVTKLAARQRPDGSFAQLDGLLGDPYATAQAIVALREAGAMPASDPVIQRAVKYLLARQVTDGSWFVATRALRFQPFFDSGFPQGRSQYSSALATAWAVMALADVQ
jgi:ankyrin repeat protein